RNLKRKRFAVLERRAAVESQARNTQHGELDSQYVSLFSRWIIPRRAVHRADRRIGKCPGVKSRSVLGAVIVPKTDRVPCNLCHVTSPLRSINNRGQTTNPKFYFLGHS